MTDHAPHSTSVAVWDVPSPAAVDSAFVIRVGVACAQGCALTGHPITVRDAAGRPVAAGRLGAAPAPGTGALYDADVTLTAPGEEGVHSWTVTFSSVESEPTHEDATSTFSFRTSKSPEHRVAVTVRDRDTAAPLDQAQVRLGFYRASTDARGRATLEVTTGRYNLNVRKVGYDPHVEPLMVNRSVTVEVAAVCTSDPDPDSDQVWM